MGDKVILNLLSRTHDIMDEIVILFASPSEMEGDIAYIHATGGNPGGWGLAF